MCYTIPILKTEEEFWADDSEDSTASANEVTVVPENFKDWVKDNQERIARAEERETLPYFIRDNRETVEEILNPKEEPTPYLDYTTQSETHGYGARKKGKGRDTDPYAYVHPKPPKLTYEQNENVREIASLLGIPESEIRPMNFYEADKGKGNINYGQGKIYEDNCFVAVLAHELRLRGLNITALGFDKKDVNNELMQELHKQFENAWLHPEKGKKIGMVIIGDSKWRDKLKKTKKNNNPLPIWSHSDEELKKAMEEKISTPGRYHIGINPLKGDGHVIVAEKLSNGQIIYFDPQRNIFPDWSEWRNLQYLELLRVDNLLFDSKKTSKIVGLIK